jgi:hypothetical protein
VSLHLVKCVHYQESQSYSLAQRLHKWDLEVVKREEPSYKKMHILCDLRHNDNIYVRYLKLSELCRVVDKRQKLD